MRIKKSSKRSVTASKHMKLGRKIMASTGKKIPYDLVSMAAIIRDYASIPRDAYASDEHMLLTDIADTLYNVGRSAAKTFKNEYAELYRQYGEAYFDQVLDDMSRLDSQVSSNNIEELIEDYESRLDSAIRAATKIRASRASRVMAASDDDPNFGDIAGLAKQSAYSYIVIARQGFERLLKFVDEVLRDEFNSSYRTAGTVSLGDTDSSAIFTITPVCDGEWLEDSALNIYYDVFGVEVKGFAGRPYRMVVKAAINDDVIAYGDNFDDIQVEVAQDIAESCRLNWDEFWDDDIESSTKIAKRPIKAGRPIMAGAGAGYNIEWSLNRITSVHSFTPISTEVDQYGDVIVDAECDIDADITINAANSYYEGASDLDLDTTAKISRIAIEIYVGDDESADDVIANLPYMNAQELDSILYSMGATTGGDHHSGEWKSSLGGGWVHSTFNGVLADADDTHSVIDGFDGWTVTLTDKEVINYIDMVVTGEDTYTGYALYDQDGEYIDKFGDLMDAQNKAEELIASGEYESIECVREDTKIYFDGTSEEVYNETEFVIDEPADI